MRGLPVELLPMGEYAVICIPLSLPDQVRDRLVAVERMYSK
jgi:hypothetical protein